MEATGEDADIHPDCLLYTLKAGSTVEAPTLVIVSVKVLT